MLPKLLAHWWNGTWSKIARKDIWVEFDGDLYQVRWRKGVREGDDGVRWRSRDKRAAWAVVRKLMTEVEGEQWTRLV